MCDTQDLSHAVYHPRSSYTVPPPCINQLCYPTTSATVSAPEALKLCHSLVSTECVIPQPVQLCQPRSSESVRFFCILHRPTVLSHNLCNCVILKLGTETCTSKFELKCFFWQDFGLFSYMCTFSKHLFFVTGKFGNRWMCT